MSEEKKELNEEQLTKVAGGAGGIIPVEGIVYTEYDENDIEINRYYASPDKKKVVYLYEISFYIDYSFTDYNFNIQDFEVTGSSWTSETLFPGSVKGRDKFMEEYPYQLNIC